MSEFTLEGKFRDDIAPGLQRDQEQIAQTVTSIKTLSKATEEQSDNTSKWQRELERLGGSLDDSKAKIKTVSSEYDRMAVALEDTVISLQAQKKLLQDEGYSQTALRAAQLRKEINDLTLSISNNSDETKKSKNTLTDFQQEVNSVYASLQNQNRALLAQATAMKRPEYAEAAQEHARLKNEVKSLTRSFEGAAVGAKIEGEAGKALDSVEKGIFSNMRTRREALVMAHEAMMGRTKNLMGSAMVFAEYADLDIMKTVTSMITPVTVGVGLASVAVVGLGVELVRLSEKAAENYHQMELLGAQSGSTAEEIIALQHAAIGTEVSTKTLADSFGKFTLRLGEHRAELAKVGVTARDPKEAFAQLMDVVAGTSDASERNRIMNLALGESWKQLAPFVLKGGDAFRQALKEMQIPDSTKKRYEEINALQEENAKNWDTIKQHAAGAAAGVLEDIDKIKLGFTELAKQRGLLSEIGNVAAKTAGGALAGTMVAPGVGTVVGGAVGLGAAVYGLYNEGDDAAKRMAARPKPGGGAGIQGPSEALLKQRSAEEATLRKNDIKTALADEDKRYKDELALAKDYSNKLKAAGQKDQGDVEKAERAHQMRVDEIRKSFQRKTPKGRATHDDTTAAIKAQAAEDQRAAAEAAKMLAEAQATSTKQGGLGAQREVGHQELDRWLAEEQQKFLGHKDALLAIQANYRAKMKALDDQFDAKESAEQKKGDLEYLKEVQARQDAKLEKMKKAFQEEEQEAKDAGAKEGETFADAWMLAVDSRLQKTKPVIEQVADLLMTTMDTAINSISSGFAGMIVQGKSFRSTLDSIGETIETEVISSIIKMGLQYVEETALRLTTSTAANAVTLAEGTATATALAAAWAPAATAASIASFGAADAAGAAGMATAYAAGDAYAVGFAGGGVQFGSAYTGERGPEISTPTVPQRITQVSQSTVHHSYGGGTIIINTGASVDRVAAVAVRATTRQARGMVRSSR